MASAIETYRKYHIEKHDERLGLFRVLARRYEGISALYPGCFVHVTPSFVFPSVIYADMDRRAARFFADPTVVELVRREKTYPDTPRIRFIHQDYSEPLDLAEETVDLLISQYAGFVSRACKRYLRIGGILVANNSHGDASMAALDPSFRLIGVVRRRGERFTLTEHALDEFMIPKKLPAPTQQDLEQAGRGPAFTKAAFAYVFERIEV